MHVLGTASVSSWMMRQSHDLIRQLVGALRDPTHRARFAGHEAYLITDADPALRGTRNQRNTGGDGFSLFNETLVCAEAVDTMYPDAEPRFRAWNTPVHEFGHAIELTLGLQQQSDAVFKQHVPDYKTAVAREYFCWAVQEWFASTPNGGDRQSMPAWKFDYLKTIFSRGNQWIPTCTADRPRVTRPTPTAVLPSTRQPVLTPDHLETLVGTYRRHPVENQWHVGRITVAARDPRGQPTVLRWTNDAGVSWGLFPDLANGRLRTDEENPYHRSNPASGQAFLLALEPDLTARGQPPPCRGFWFQDQLYFKDR